MPQLESALAQLETSNLIRLATDEIDLAYIFKHALTQEAAYGTMLKSRRSELHRRAAQLSSDSISVCVFAIGC